MPVIYDRITEHSERIVEDLGDLEAPLVQQMHAGGNEPRSHRRSPRSAHP